MKLDYQEIQHNYITRLIIFALFLYKELRKHQSTYLFSVQSFIQKRINYDIELTLEVGPILTLDEQRNTQIESLLDDRECRVLNLVVVEFKTGFKDKITLQINLNEEEKYSNFLYL